MKYDQIPDDFPTVELDKLDVSRIPKDDKARADYSTRYRVIDGNGNEFLVIEESTRKDNMSDYLHVSQSSGDAMIHNPTVIQTEMWASGGSNLPQRAILTAMREFEN